MTKTAPPRFKTNSRRVARPAMTVKWLVVLAALSVATVLDGISISDVNKSALSRVEEAAITLPSDRCSPGCTIMMASNQPVSASIDRIQ
jgi:hypothetical protein